MPDPILPGPLWMVGCGHMGSAMLAGWIAGGVDPAHVTVIRPSGRPAGDGVRILTHFPEDEVPAIVLLAMKPQKLDEATAALPPILDPETILVSILAGVELASLRSRFPAPRNIVRAMPNLPARLGQGVVGLCADGADPAARALVGGLMAALGHAEWFDDERDFNLVTALSGSGPAFVFRFIAALAEAGARLGMPPDQARRFAAATVAGAAALAQEEGADLDALARMIASPGGTTEAGLQILDTDRALAGLIERTLEAARRRGVELAQAARK